LGPLDIVVANAADVVLKPVVECTEQDSTICSRPT